MEETKKRPADTRKREMAAVLIAEGDKEMREIAEACGIDLRRLYRWWANPEFKARVDEIKTANAVALEGDGVRRKDNRLNTYQDIADRIHRIISERAQEMGKRVMAKDDDVEYEVPDIPGGASGLLVRQYTKSGQPFYKFDAALVSQLNATLKQAAQEAGQWTDRREVKEPVSAKDDGTGRTDIDRAAKLLELINAARARAGAANS